MFEKRYTDESMLVSAYLKYNSQTKAAEEIGCSRETIARAVRKAGIPMNGRRNVGDHKGNYGGGSPTKLTDAELIEESSILSRTEIAHKHQVDICNVDRKLARLGIRCVKKTGSGSRYKERAISRAAEYMPGITLQTVIERYRNICQICGRPCDTTDRSKKTVGPLYPTIDHIRPLSKGGGHTWDNVQLAHMKCNYQKGDNWNDHGGKNESDRSRKERR